MSAAKVISALKVRFAVNSDSDLAKALGVDKSTVSSWKARNKVPFKYRNILVGAANAGFISPPVRWGDRESAAFSIALFRFCAAVKDVVEDGSIEPVTEWFTSNGVPFWAVFAVALEDVDDKMQAVGRSADEARMIILANEAQHSERAAQNATSAIKRVHAAWTMVED